MDDHISAEIRSQPAVWRRAASLASTALPLPPHGCRVAAIGCGTSYHIAQAYAVAREAAGRGETDAFCASEMPCGRDYRHVVAISRSGTTTEVLRALDALDGRAETVALTAAPRTPVAERATHRMVLDFADEESVVQTRFATAALALLRAHLGEDVSPAARAAERALDEPAKLPSAAHFVFLGRGWTVGLAHEAALKLREIAGAWAESYPAMEYRHGPISVAGERTVVWSLGDLPDGLPAEIAATGARLLGGDRDPMAELVRIQSAAVAIARAAGLDPDRPPHLTRSVVLH